jgi:GDPmannose 4,6-dehydratase
VGDASRAHDELGWEPKTEFADLLARMVEKDIERERARAGLA